MAKEIKITYKSLTKSSYETDRSGVAFSAKINGVECQGYWRPISQYTKYGVDINDLKVGGKSVTIFSGGSHKTYEIYCRNMPPTEKQPKNLQFTGRTISVENLKDVFVNKIKEGLQTHEVGNMTAPQLTKEFLQAFNII